MRILSFRKKLHMFYKTKPTKDFVIRRLLPIYNVYELKDGIPIIFNKNEAKDKILDLIDEFTYTNTVLRKIEDKAISPITVLRHHLQEYNYSVLIKERVVNNKHIRDYILIDLSKPTYEIKKDDVLLNFN
jgi:hypothetical protein